MLTRVCAFVVWTGASGWQKRRMLSSSSLLGPHTHAGGCFRVFNTRCLWLLKVLSPAQVLHTWQQLYSDSKTSPTLLCLLSWYKHMLLCLNMASGAPVLFSTAWFIITSSSSGGTLWRDRACVGIMCGLNCAGSGFVFMGKWPQLIADRWVCCCAWSDIWFLWDEERLRGRGGREIGRKRRWSCLACSSLHQMFR